MRKAMAVKAMYPDLSREGTSGPLARSPTIEGNSVAYLNQTWVYTAFKNLYIEPEPKPRPNHFSPHHSPSLPLNHPSDHRANNSAAQTDTLSLDFPSAPRNTALRNTLGLTLVSCSCHRFSLLSFPSYPLSAPALPFS